MTEKQMRVPAVIKPPRDFEMSDGKKLVSHDVVFEDGEEGSTITSPSTDEITAMQDALKAIRGQQVEFELDNPREYQGVRKWKIVQFPGKPKGQGGGGGRGRDWVDQTPSMEAQGAVKNAINAIGPLERSVDENIPAYLGQVRELAFGLYKVVQDIKKQTAPAAHTPIQELAVKIFGSEGAVQVAFRTMFGEGTSFAAITENQLQELIEQKEKEEVGV